MAITGQVRRSACALLVVCFAAPTVSCGGGADGPDLGRAGQEPSVAAEIVQLRRDQVLERVQVALRNTGSRDVVVRAIRLEVRGFRLPAAIRKNSPLPAGQAVNFPVPYAGVDCRTGDEPQVGPGLVTVSISATGDRQARTVRVRAVDTSGLLARIAARTCAVEEVRRQVELSFDDQWRLEPSPDGTRAYGTLRVELLAGPRRDVTQLAGAIMYGLAPDDGADEPLASVSTQHPEAAVPVVVWAARCDGHVKGEIKKPYEFLVWVSGPDGEELAVTPAVGERTKRALRNVCAF